MSTRLQVRAAPAPTTSRSAPASAAASPSSSTVSTRRSAASSSRTRPSGACTASAAGVADQRGADPAPGRRALQEPADRRPHLRRADPRRGRPRHAIVAIGGGVARRHRRLRRGDVPARHPGRPGADDAAGAGGQRDRRQGRRQPRAGQEPDRRLPSARGSSSSIPTLLSTLPRREFRAGLYEVVKYGVIASRPLFERLQSGLPALFAREPEALMPVIAESCRIKAAVVEQDERESGPRRTLNFGHTAGHALEAVTKYRRFRHGEAVGLRDAGGGGARGRARDDARGRPRRAGGAHRADGTAAAVVGPARPRDASKRSRHDKKVVAGRLHFVLPARHRRGPDRHRRDEGRDRQGGCRTIGLAA